MNDIKGKTALITGGTKGIGYGIAEMLLKKGVSVCITGRNTETVKEAAEKLNQVSDATAIGITADVRSYSDMENVIDHMVSQLGKVDAVIANAGLGHFGSIMDLTHEQFTQTVDTNLTGVFNTIKPALNALKESRGYIITIASLAGTNFFAGGSAYNASKFGLVGFTQAVMLDLRQHDIKVSTIMPGSVTSHFAGHTPNEADAWKIQPEDIGEMVVYLLETNPRNLPSKIEVRPSKPPK
ncbi:SDR family oxidoreductase [Cryomorphaceae bacterium 1068]|nr:SDR family oxidoreductase [Cryomorphaceae bacterium 1068]